MEVSSLIIARIKTKNNTLGQLLKCGEEFFELIIACAKRNKQEILSEAFDLIQAVFTLLLMVKGYSKLDIETHSRIHNQKLEIRNHEKKIKVEYWVDI